MADIYLRGDTHGVFENVKQFCEEHHTSKEDILVILGDAGVNYMGLPDRRKKEFLESLPITLLCIHGNHEMRPYTIPTYEEILWQEGIVYAEQEFPHILFAKDGEIYNLNGKRTIAIGGAYSVDKYYRLAWGYRWWQDEQPSEAIKAYVEAQLEKCGWNIDFVLSHTVPLKYEPTEAFIPQLDQSRVDKSMEQWLNTIEERLTYEAWYAGHYHIEKQIDKLEILFENYKKL